MDPVVAAAEVRARHQQGRRPSRQRGSCSWRDLRRQESEWADRQVVQIEVVVDVKATANPELAVAFRLSGVPTT